MFTHFRRNAVAYLALFVALGGTSYAVVKLPKGVVGTKQLKNGAVTKKKLAKGALPKVIAGTPGTPGVKGDKGDQGVAGPGAEALVYRAAATAQAPESELAKIGPFTILASCALNGSDAVTLVLKLVSSGAAFVARGLVSIQTNGTGTPAPIPFNDAGDSTSVLTLIAGDGVFQNLYTTRLTYTVGSSVYDVPFTAVADARGPDRKCTIDGLMTPAS